MTRSEATARFRRETAEAIESYRNTLKGIVRIYKRDFSNPLMRLAFQSAWEELTLDLAEISHCLDDARDTESTLLAA